MKTKELIAKAKQAKTAAILEAKVRLQDLFQAGGDFISFKEPCKVDHTEVNCIKKELDNDWEKFNKKEPKSVYGYVKHTKAEIAVLNHKMDCTESIFNTYPIVGNEKKMQIIEAFDFSTTIKEVNLIYVSIVTALEVSTKK